MSTEALLMTLFVALLVLSPFLTLLVLSHLRKIQQENLEAMKALAETMPQLAQVLNETILRQTTMLASRTTEDYRSIRSMEVGLGSEAELDLPPDPDVPLFEIPDGLDDKDIDYNAIEESIFRGDGFAL